MKRSLTVPLVLVLGVVSWHCAGDAVGVSVPDLPESLLRVSGEEYLYSAFDASGREVVRGSMHITIEDSTRVSGRWDLSQTDPEATMIGPQSGEGTLIGMIQGTEIWMNLNPDNADNNVMLLGSCGEQVIEGTWQFVGFPGVLGSGSFRAERVDN